jgi:hypothetical protein
MAQSIWTKESGQELPSDLPSGRYEFRFAVSQTVAALAIAAFWQNKADTLDVNCGNGQHFLPLAIYIDGSDLVILADIVGFWPQLLAVALTAIGLGIVAYITLREIRVMSENPALAVAFPIVALVLLTVAIIVLVKMLQKG